MLGPAAPARPHQGCDSVRTERTHGALRVPHLTREQTSFAVFNQTARRRPRVRVVAQPRVCCDEMIGPQHLLLSLTLVACGSRDERRDRFPTCPDRPLFSVAPIALDDFMGLTPLGHLAPPGHTFPTDHMYFYMPAGAVVPVVSPGDVTITTVALMQPFGGHADYQIYFKPCRQYLAYYDHVTTLSPWLAAQIGSFDDSPCMEYGDPGRPFRRCVKDVNIALAAGEVVGTAGVTTFMAALDLGAMDGRAPILEYANPARIPRDPDGVDRLHVVCPLDAYAQPVRDQLRARISDYQGNRRQREPACGQVMQDIKGRAKGNWYVKGTPLFMSFPEDPHLALADDNDFNTDRQVFSVGTSMNKSGLTHGPYFFRPATSGDSNRPFQEVTPQAGPQCYDDFDPKLQPGAVLLLQMPTSTTLRLERIAAPSCDAARPWAFTSRATEFER